MTLLIAKIDFPSLRRRLTLHDLKLPFVDSFLQRNVNVVLCSQLQKPVTDTSVCSFRPQTQNNQHHIRYKLYHPTFSNAELCTRGWTLELSTVRAHSLPAWSYILELGPCILYLLKITNHSRYFQCSDLHCIARLVCWRHNFHSTQNVSPEVPVFLLHHLEEHVVK